MWNNHFASVFLFPKKRIFFNHTLIFWSVKQIGWKTEIFASCQRNGRTTKMFRNIRFNFLPKSRQQLRPSKLICPKQREMIVCWETRIFIAQNVRLCDYAILFIRLHNYWPYLHKYMWSEFTVATLSIHFLIRGSFALKNYESKQKK